MLKPNALLVFLLTALLTACGGSGDPVAGGNNNNDDGSTGSVDNGDGTSDDVTTGINIQNPRLGTGTGSTFAVGALVISNTSLSAGGTTNISANIVDSDRNNAKIVSQQYAVRFSSSCSEADPAKASFSRSESITSSGEVSVTYEAKGCKGTDIISFKLFAVSGGVVSGDSPLHTATGTVSVLPPEVGAITYVETSSPAISIATIANPVLPPLALVRFKVLDRNNNPIEGKQVDFTLTNTAGGTSLALDSAITNEDGVAVATVNAGTTHGVVAVNASTLANDGVTTITTSSLPISVTTGIPDQDSFSVVADVLNPGAYDVSGVTVNITAYAADQFQNPVPDGTVINFTAESGSIPSSCTTINGLCTVEWRSQNYRPGQEAEAQYASLNRVNETDPLKGGASVKGLTTILAYTIGEAGFTDSNNNGLFDAGESFMAFAEPIRDDDLFNLWLNNDTTDLDTNANGPVEFIADFNNDGLRTAAPSVYQGALCTTAARQLGHCASLMYVRDSVVITQAATAGNNIQLFDYSYNAGTGVYTFTPFSGVTNTPGDSGTFAVLVMDANGNMPASGVTLSITGDGYDITSDAGEVRNSVGYLDPSRFVGLPTSFGDVFFASWQAEAAPEKIEIKASGDGARDTVLRL